LSQINPADFENELMSFIEKFALSDVPSGVKSAIDIIPTFMKHFSLESRKILVG
jgi:hypothetical protein